MAFSPIVNGTGVIGWEFLSRTRDKQQAVFEKSPLIARDTAKFKEQIQSIQSSEQLLDNRDLLRVALGAFGLDEDLNNRAFLKRVLDSDLSDDTSLANKLADKRYLGLAQTFNFAGTDGPMVSSKPASDLSVKLGALQTPEDLLSDRSLLRATLDSFGLGDSIGNTFFLQNVLEFDLSDDNSFVNRLSDKRYLELAKTFDFQGKSHTGDTVYGFATAFSDRLGDIETADDLLDDPELLDSALRVFGLDRDFANLDSPGFLRNVFESDPYDDDSFAARLDDKRYLALSNAFGLGDSDTEQSRAAKLVDMLSKADSTVQQPQDLFNDVGLTLAVMNFFDLPQGPGKIDFARRIMDSDLDSPTSLANVFPDRRYGAFAEAFDFKEPSTTREYPPGFVDSITQSYTDRQFENGVGDSDVNMRVALSLDRDLNDLISRGRGNDTQWFAVMASKPLRTVFETAFGLPSSFGTLDLDQQLGEFKERSEQMFGTDRVSDFADPDRMDRLRRRFLLSSEQQNSASFTSGAGVVLALLSGYSA